MDSTNIGEAPMLLPSLLNQAYIEDSTPDLSRSNTASACNSTYGSDGVFDRQPLRSPINGSESEYEDEDDCISEMPPESHAPSCCGDEAQDSEIHTFDEYTPGRRIPFRNPSSVRGMQLDTTPPHIRSPLRESMSRARERFSMGSRNSTPRSVRSHRSGSPTKSRLALKKENLLVLLHVTILPISCPYSQKILQDVAPSHVLKNWKLLREKVPDTVLERGILIPHPREEYELLEERLLESLELVIPRILKCGHFHRQTTDDEESDTERRSVANITDDPADDSGNDSDVCVDCTRHIRDGSRGSAGTGKRRWNIRFYAANGLMRAGAWTAAWKEMERVDVEISPWMDDDLRRKLNLRKIQEEEDHAKTIAREHDATHSYPIHLQGSPSTMDEARRREIYGDRPTAPASATHRRERVFTPGEIVEAYEHSPVLDSDEFFNPGDAAAFLDEEQQSLPPKHRTPSSLQVQQIPLSELLRNYVKLLLQDRRNVALTFLSVVVVWLALRPSGGFQTSSIAHQLNTVPDMIQEILTPTAAAEIVTSAESSLMSASEIPPIEEGKDKTLSETVRTSTVDEIQEHTHDGMTSVLETVLDAVLDPAADPGI